MPDKKLCPICNSRKAERKCISRSDEICARCCGIVRKLGECDRNCTFSIPLTTESKPIEGLPIYKVLRSKPQGSIIIIVAREHPDDKNIQFISLLIDVWKMGLKDGMGSHKILKNSFMKKISSMPNEFIETTLPEVHWLVKQGLRIAKEMNTRIPREFDEYKYILGKLDDTEVKGSLYKCFKCEKGELSNDDVALIKSVAIEDIAAGVCGTPHEIILYVTCDKCKKS